MNNECPYAGIVLLRDAIQAKQCLGLAEIKGFKIGLREKVGIKISRFYTGRV